MESRKEFLFLNGQIIPSEQGLVHVGDIGILRGYGAFDFFRVIDGHPVFLEDYLDRFERSVLGLHLHHPFSRQELKDAINRLIELHPAPLLGIRMVCTGGYADDAYTPVKGNLVILARPFAFHPFDQGLKLMSVEFQRELFHLKSTNYLVPISQIPRLKASGYDDVLYHKGGLVSESSRSNLFIVKNETLITPDTGILEGVTRKRILQFADQLMPVEIRPVSIAELHEADEVFLSASTKRISPVIRIDQTTYVSGSWTKQLYERLIEEENLEKQ